MSNPFRFRIAGVSDTWHVIGFKGREEVNKPYRFTIDLLGEHGVSAEEILGFQATLEITTSARTRFVHGVVGACDIRSRHEDGRSWVRVRLEPRFGLLRHASGYRVFHELPVTGIVSLVLLEHQVPFELRASRPAAFLPRAHRIQRGERDLAFLERILAEDGMFYWFEQSSNDVAGEMLVIADTAGAYSLLDGTAVLRHVAASADVSVAHDHSIFAMHYRSKMRTDKNITRRYEHVRPQVRLGLATLPLLDQVEVQRLTPRRCTSYEHEHNVEGLGGLPLEGLLPDAVEQVVEEIAGMLAGTSADRLEARRREAKVAEGKTIYPHLAPGYTFRVDEHSESALNREYVTLRVHHVGRAPERGHDAERTYEAAVALVPRETPMRPRRPKRPLARGLETATVIGPPGEEIFTDNQGRIQVRFHWDLEMDLFPPVTAWLRVAQSWAGSHYGANFTPRVGNEVLVGFIDGDMDKPIVIGSVHNILSGPPWSFPHDKTKSGIMTHSSPRGAAGHELTFQDRAGEEVVAMRSSRTLEVSAAQDGHLQTGTTFTLGVGTDAAERIAGNSQSTCGGDRTVTISGDRRVEIAQADRTTVGADCSIAIGGNQVSQVAGFAHVTYGIGRYTVVGRDVTSQADDLLAVNGQYTLGASKPVTITSVEAVILQCGTSRIRLEPGCITLDAEELKLKTSKGMNLTHGEGDKQSSLSMNGAMVLSGPQVGLQSSQGGSVLLGVEAIVEASAIKLKAGAASGAPKPPATDGPLVNATFKVLADGLPSGTTEVTLIVATPTGELVERPCAVGGTVSFQGREGEKFMVRAMKVGDETIAVNLPHVENPKEGE